MNEIASRRELLVTSERPNEGLPDYVDGRYGWGAIRGRDSVVQAVIHRVVLRELGIGHMSSEKELAIALGMSRTPLREALAVLSSNGLVRQIPQRGFFVVRVDEDDALETIAIRRGIEPQIASHLAETRAEAAIELRQIAQAMDGVSEPEFGDRDTQLHVRLAEIAGFHNGARALLTWRNQLRIFRAERVLTADDRTDVVREHMAIVDAIASRQPDAAGQAADRHLENTALRIAGQAPRAGERSAARDLAFSS
jgi:DNA-binding GntR family transcriptional regulator